MAVVTYALAYLLSTDSPWQDLSGFPKGADPKSCASVGDVTKEWCVMLGVG